MTQEKASWIKTGIQSVLVAVLTAAILNASSFVGSKLDKVYNKLDKIDEHEARLGFLEEFKHHADSIFTMQVLLNDNRQRGEWELDKKTDGIILEQEGMKSNIDVLFKYCQPK